MPTPAGLPKVGERIRAADMRSMGTDAPKKWSYGTVLRRTGGTGWSILVSFDDDRPYEKKHGRWLTTAGWLMQKGFLEVVS